MCRPVRVGEIPLSVPADGSRTVSRENAVIGTCIALTVAVALLVESLNLPYPEWVPLALFIGGGVVVPLTINETLNRREAA